MPDIWRQYRSHIVMFVLYLAVLIGVIYVLRRPEPRVITITTPPPHPSPTLAWIQVQVRGAVNQPGVYSFTVGTRLAEALSRAGSALPDADVGALNLARKLNDGEDVFVPSLPVSQTGSINVIPAGASAAPAPPTAILRININTASVEQLDALPHIGPALAQRIVDYREQNGPFQRLEDIKNVKGIGDSIFQDLKDLITLQ